MHHGRQQDHLECDAVIDEILSGRVGKVGRALPQERCGQNSEEGEIARAHNPLIDEVVHAAVVFGAAAISQVLPC